MAVYEHIASSPKQKYLHLVTRNLTWVTEMESHSVSRLKFSDLNPFDWWRGQATLRKSPEGFWLFKPSPKGSIAICKGYFIVEKGKYPYVSWITRYWAELAIISGHTKNVTLVY